MAAVRLFLLSLFVFCLRTNPSHAIGEDVHLIDFKESLKDSSPLDSSWIKGSNPCDAKKPWQGIDCSDTGSQAVSAILLMNRGLSGAGPDLDIDALSKLGSLRFLSLENNSFSGPLPEFNQLSSLRSLFLSGNQFSGEIPQGYFDKMGSLKKLHLARNKFTGPIPGSLTKLSNLMEMWLQENEFSGSVPSFEQNLCSRSTCLTTSCKEKFRKACQDFQRRFSRETLTSAALSSPSNAKLRWHQHQERRTISPKNPTSLAPSPSG
ncbi:UNVERIFIED_CONTAM: hypothetical protein Sangu_1524500 [Sesamum angustifolium]|uniref:Leucine-rich repeat-containing N-terminal plant-type domain-containing protein n=1 Tax=Sesamum angustifolium TaxID=2727405 RepID=A0AAW2MT14_9LAMI